MENNQRVPQKLASFSERTLALLNSRNSLRFPSQDDVTKGEPYDLTDFHNQLPRTDLDIRRSLVQQNDEADVTGYTILQDAQRDILAGGLLFPTAVICIPIALLSATLLGLVYFYKIEPHSGLFNSPEPRQKGSAYVLVNFSASEYL